MREIQKAKNIILLRSPFFGSLLLKLKFEETDKFPTMATDNEYLYYNPEFVKSLSQKHLIFVLLHELMHCVFLHPLRREERDIMKWNIACDITVNNYLMEVQPKLNSNDSFWEVLGGCVHKQEWAEYTAEEIYRLLPEEENQKRNPIAGDVQEPAQRNGQNGNESGNEQQGSGISQSDKFKEIEAEWKKATYQAAMVERQAGNDPGFMDRIINRILEPKLDPLTILREFINQVARNDYNWTKPNKRYVQSGFVLPSLINNELGEIVVAVDTSGSISQDELDEFAAELGNILEVFDTTIHVIYVDTKVASYQEFTKDDLPLKLEPKGGGGTNFRPAFEWVENSEVEPVCMIYFTDLYGTFPRTEPEYPVLWITKTKNKGVPFGQKITL